MKENLFFGGLILMLLLIVSCEKTPSEPQPIGGGDVECVTNDECIKGGCSGTICQSKNMPPVFTTCEYLPEYDCYKEINCECIDGKCEWSKTEKFDKCVREARESGGKLVV